MAGTNLKEIQQYSRWVTALWDELCSPPESHRISLSVSFLDPTFPKRKTNVNTGVLKSMQRHCWLHTYLFSSMCGSQYSKKKYLFNDTF